MSVLLGFTMHVPTQVIFQVLSACTPHTYLASALLFIALFAILA
jgi:hypothetical protein